MISNDQDAAKRILFELCQQVEDAFFSETEEEFKAFFAGEEESDSEKSDTNDEEPKKFFERTSNPAKTHNPRSSGFIDLVDPTDF